MRSHIFGIKGDQKIQVGRDLRKGKIFASFNLTNVKKQIRMT